MVAADHWMEAVRCCFAVPGVAIEQAAAAAAVGVEAAAAIRYRRT